MHSKIYISLYISIYKTHQIYTKLQITFFNFHPQSTYQSCHGGYLIQDFLTTLNLSHIRIEVEKCARIFYNKVPKCGSRTVTTAVRQSGTSGRFTLVNQVQLQPHTSFDLVQQVRVTSGKFEILRINTHSIVFFYYLLYSYN